ncbi:MAG: hypothetical protein CMO01_25940 [Thalassobius sp.]|nr:hypothetical protein [Thalassovita sp.]
MHPHIIMPSPQLRSVVERYEYWDFGKVTNFSNRLMAMPCIENGILFSFYNAENIILKSELIDYESLPATALMSTLTSPLYNLNTNSNNGIRVMFHRGLLPKLFNFSMKSFQNMPVDSSYEFDKDLHFLYEKIGESQDYRYWIIQIENYLLKKLRFISFDKNIFDYINQIFIQEGYSNSIQNLADKLGMSVRHFNRLVNKELGFSLSELIRVHRFNRVLMHFESSDKINLTNVAHQFGYYDQSHFNREFKQMTLQTPKEYLRSTNKCFIHTQEDILYPGGFACW